jgi:group I intron endonuclease
MKISGIYQIKNLINNKIYIGSSYNINARMGQHFSNLKHNKHANPKLQAAYNKYGKENFIFKILITCDPTMLFWYEQQFIDQWKPKYNISKASDCPMRGRKLTDIQCQKMSEYKKGCTYRAAQHGSLVSPDGIIYKEIFNMAKFCREHNLCSSSILHVLHGKFKQYKGWVTLENYLNPIEISYPNIISPDGVIYRGIKDMTKFRQEHNISSKHWSALLSGKHKHYHGWKISKE